MKCVVPVSWASKVERTPSTRPIVVLFARVFPAAKEIVLVPGTAPRPGVDRQAA
jgi:hypothetical protein